MNKIEPETWKYAKDDSYRRRVGRGEWWKEGEGTSERI